MPAKTSHLATEVLGVLGAASVKISQDVIEVLVTNATKDPTTPTYVGISQDVVEVLTALPNPQVYVSQVALEILCGLVDINVGVVIPTQTIVHGFGYVS